MGRFAFFVVLCLFAVMPQRVCMCHGVDIGRREAPPPEECPHDHNPDCPCLEGSPFAFAEFLKSSAACGVAPPTFAELLPVTAPDTVVVSTSPVTLLAESSPYERGVPIYISLLTLRN